MDEEGRHFIEVMTITKNGANYLVTTTHPNFVSPGISDRTDPGIYHDGMIAALGRDMAHIKSPDSVVWLGTTYYRGRTGTP